MGSSIRFLVINGHVYVWWDFSDMQGPEIYATIDNGVPAYDFRGGHYLIQRSLSPKDFIQEPETFVYGRDT
jgi:hypothetical protein